jgi:hypothetical protein
MIDWRLSTISLTIASGGESIDGGKSGGRSATLAIGRMPIEKKGERT